MRRTNDWTKAHVTVGQLGVFPAEMATFTRWNGWACPRFTRQVAEDIVTALARENLRPGSQDNERLHWEGDVLVLTSPPHINEQGYQPERIQPDDDGLYGIGSHAWTWLEVKTQPKPPRPVNLGEALELVLDWVHLRTPTDSSTWDWELICQECGQHIGDVEDDDSLALLARTALDHVPHCPAGLGTPLQDRTTSPPTEMTLPTEGTASP